MAITADQVRGVIDTDLSDNDLAHFIDPAVQVVDARYDASKCDMSSGELDTLKIWLAAHFVAQRGRQVSSTKLGDASDTYTGQYGMKLDSTQYGQTAMLLDRCGILGDMGKRRARLDMV